MGQQANDNHGPWRRYDMTMSYLFRWGSSFATAKRLDEIHRGVVERLACDSESHKGLDQGKKTCEMYKCMN